MFAGHVESTRRQGILVDSTSFRMATHEMDPGWRDANIIPRYNAAGVRRFAFHMPEGMPAIGAEPAPEGPGQLPDRLLRHPRRRPGLARRLTGRP
jgi:hypothetical protein